MQYQEEFVFPIESCVLHQRRLSAPSVRIQLNESQISIQPTGYSANDIRPYRLSQVSIQGNDFNRREITLTADGLKVTFNPMTDRMLNELSIVQKAIQRYMSQRDSKGSDHRNGSASKLPSTSGEKRKREFSSSAPPSSPPMRDRMTYHQSTPLRCDNSVTSHSKSSLVQGNLITCHSPAKSPINISYPGQRKSFCGTYGQLPVCNVRNYNNLKNDIETKLHQDLLDVGDSIRSHSFPSIPTYNSPNGGDHLNKSRDDQYLLKGRQTRDRLSGMKNLGNTCYMNATVQALLNMHSFIDYLLSSLWKFIFTKISQGQQSDSILCTKQLVMLAKVNLKADHGILSLAQFKEAISRKAKQYRGLNQHDAHEFLNSLFSILESEIVDGLRNLLHIELTATKAQSESSPADSQNDVVDSKPANDNDNDGPVEMNITTPEQNSEYLHREVNIQTVKKADEITGDQELISLDAFLNILPTQLKFGGRVEVKLECTTCSHCRVVEEKYTDYSLKLPTDLRKTYVALHELLAGFFSEEIREYTCENCRTPDGKVKASNCFLETPEILVLHLKRFRYDPREGQFSKLYTSVDFPPFLDISEFTMMNKRLEYLDKLNQVNKKTFDTLHTLCQSFHLKTNAADNNRMNELLNGDAPLTPIKSNGNGHLKSIPASSPNDGDYGWVCSRCTFQNKKDYLQCEMCRHILDEESANAMKSIQDPRSESPVEEVEDTVPELPPLNSIEIAKTNGTQYKLVAIIRHHGTSIAAGHYVCDILTKNTNHVNTNVNLTSSAWYRCNDAIVSPVPEETVFNEKDSPYILFYEKVR